MTRRCCRCGQFIRPGIFFKNWHVLCYFRELIELVTGL